MTSLDTILSALDRPKRVATNKYMAGCPCCQSRKGRPIAVTAVDDRVLLHAFCGCGTESVLSALGLTVSDLFDTPKEPRAEPRAPRVSARDILANLAQEVTFVALLAADILDKKDISAADWHRLAKAASRIGAARDYVEG